MKRLLSLLIAAALTVALAGCGSDDANFFKALEKTAKLNSYAKSSEISFNINSNIPESINKVEYNSHINWKTILNSLKNFKLTADSTVSRSKDNFLSSETILGVSSEDLSFVTAAYVKSDSKTFAETYKIPTSLRWILPEAYMDAEYFTVDVSELNQYISENPIPYSVNFTKLLENTDKLNEAYFRFQAEYAKKMTTAPQIITTKGNNYTLSFTDQSLKAFMKAIVDTYLNDSDAALAAKTFAKNIFDFYAQTYPGLLGDEVKEAVYEQIDKFPENPEEFAAQSEQFFSWLENIPLLGEKGVSVTYTIDKNGYVSKIDGYVNLYIDIDKISGEQVGEPFDFDILINFKEEYSKMNQTVKVNYPTLTEKNNISYIEMIKNIAAEQAARADYWDNYDYHRPELPELPAADGNITVFYSGAVIDFGDTPPVVVDNATYAPLNKLCEGLYMGYRWDFDDNCAAINGYSAVLTHKAGTNIFSNNDYATMLTQNSFDYNGEVYVPLRSFVKAFRNGIPINYDGDRNAVFIGYNPYANK